jgi:hypothetical protein
MTTVELDESECGYHRGKSRVMGVGIWRYSTETHECDQWMCLLFVFQIEIHPHRKICCKWYDYNDV